MTIIGCDERMKLEKLSVAAVYSVHNCATKVKYANRIAKVINNASKTKHETNMHYFYYASQNHAIEKTHPISAVLNHNGHVHGLFMYFENNF